MSLKKPIFLVFTLGLLTSAGAFAQITAKTAAPEDYGAPIEIASPMQLDVPVAGDTLGMSVRRGSVMWQSKETADYTCDQAQVLKKNYKIFVRAKALSGWFRQDVDFILSLLAGDKVLVTENWDSYTLGPEEGAPFSGTPLNAEAKFKIAREEFDALLESETPLVVRVVLEVLDD